MSAAVCAASTGQSPASPPAASLARLRNTKNMPNPAPDASASPTRRGSNRTTSPPGAMLTSAMATIAQPAPPSATRPGGSSITRPTTSGTTAAVTAETGATIAIDPVDSAR